MYQQGWFGGHCVPAGMVWWSLCTIRGGLVVIVHNRDGLVVTVYQQGWFGGHCAPVGMVWWSLCTIGIHRCVRMCMICGNLSLISIFRSCYPGQRGKASSSCSG